MRITVILGDHRLPDRVKRGGKFNEEDFETIEILKKHFQKLQNYQVTYLDYHDDLLEDLKKDRPDFVFNLCDEGFYNQAQMELHVPALLEILGIPYTGSRPACLAICFNKPLVSSYAKKWGIPVPKEVVIDPAHPLKALPADFPLLLKPAEADGSFGITGEAVVHNEEELIAYVKKLEKDFSHTQILCQEFLSGSEYSVGVIGNNEKREVMPLLEVDYSSLPPHLPKILSYAFKWEPLSVYQKEIRYKPAQLDAKKERELKQYTLTMCEKLGCRDYARLDFREDSKGKIHLLEVNPNCGWSWDGTLAAMGKFKGWEYHHVLEGILRAASDRHPSSEYGSFARTA